MKRRIIVAIVGVLLVSTLSGCSSKDNKNNKQEETYKVTEKDEVEGADKPKETDSQKETNKIKETDSQKETNEIKETGRVGKVEEIPTFDFSEYDGHGRFCDGLAWVCVSDYAGTRYGYINENNEYVIPLSQDITRCYDYKNGIAVVMYGSPYYKALVLYDTYGNQVARIDDSGANTPILKYFSNGNIYIGYPQVYDIPQESYMYVSSMGRLSGLNYNLLVDKCGEDYCNGYLYSGDCFATTAAIGCHVAFYDEFGNVALVLSSETNQYYKHVYSATDFVDGKSKIIFMGQDERRYTVEIDTNGNWLGEPEGVDKDYRVR